MNKDFLNKDLSGKTIVFTGGTDGMGKEAVKMMAKMKAGIVLLGRNAEKTLKVVDELNTIAQSNNASFVQCDLASQKSIRNASRIILNTCSKIDYVINCAGANFGERKMTEDGHEMTWAVNHLAPFLLNHLLLERLKENPGSKIINLSSATEKRGHIYFEDVSLSENWSTFRSYTQAKLAMNMVTRKMAKELEGTSVSINALNPGFIKTNLLRELKGWERIIGVPYMFFFASKTEKGAERILRLAFSKDSEGVTGQFVYEDKVRDPNPEALNDDLVEKTWLLSKQHVAL